jgi:hypothetical protein
MQFDCDHPSAGFDERKCQSTKARTQVDYQLTRPNDRVSNDSLSPVRIQPVPAP